MKTYIICILCCLSSMASITQTINTEITKNGDPPFLLGEINKEGLTSKPYSSWFNQNYDDYIVDAETIKILSETLKNYNIKLFMGTWCGDSKKEVPRFYKVLEACHFPEDQLESIALSKASDLYKQSPKHEEAGLNIHRVPTFIFYRNGKEVNRIVEHPIETFEKDMLNITTKNNYTSNYEIVAKINKILNNHGLKGLKKQVKPLVNTFKGKTKNMFELNTYARILSSTQKQQEAIKVLELNTKLFPNKPHTYMSLARTLHLNQQSKKAKKTLKKGIKLFPENSELAHYFETLKTK